MNLTAKLLEGKRVLITGGGRGLGLAFAQAVARSGGRVVIADILRDEVLAAAEGLKSEGYDVTGLEVDLSQPESISSCAAKAEEILGGLDGLVNNAAVTNSGGLTSEEIDIETWDRVMQVNVRGTWLMTNACLPALRRSGAGAVINLASDTPLWGAPRLLAYTASKGAIIAMTRTLARELGADGITVNAIAPGLVLVEATEYVPQERHDLYCNQRALQRTQLPEDVCGAVIFGLSDLSRFITGQTLPVNGGFVMP